MQTGNLTPVTTLDGTHFTDALVQNASEFEQFALPLAIGSSGISRCRIRSAIGWSSQAIALEFAIYSGHDAKSPDPNLDLFRGRWQWAAGDWLQDDGSGLYRAYIDGLDIFYEDDDAKTNRSAGKLYLCLVNRSATAKIAYALGGHFRLRLHVEESRGW